MTDADSPIVRTKMPERRCRVHYVRMRMCALTMVISAAAAEEEEETAAAAAASISCDKSSGLWAIWRPTIMHSRTRDGPHVGLKSVTDEQGVISNKQLPKRQKSVSLLSTHWILLIFTRPTLFNKLTVNWQKTIIISTN